MVSMVKLPELSELTFDEGQHIYRLNGIELPRVTTLMKPLSDAKYSGVAKGSLEKAAIRGTAVHTAAEFFLNYGIKEIDPQYSTWFQAFLDWEAKYKPDVVGTEVRLYHKILRYAGTADLIAYIDGKLTIVDFKTTAQFSDMTFPVQLEAYAQMLASHGITIEQKAILQIKKDGTYRYEIYPAKDAARWAVFGALLTLGGYIKQYIP